MVSRRAVSESRASTDVLAVLVLAPLVERAVVVDEALGLPAGHSVRVADVAAIALAERSVLPRLATGVGGALLVEARILTLSVKAGLVQGTLIVGATTS